MAEWIQNLMDTLGYAGVFLLMIVENLFPPIPSEFILPSAGFAAARGELTLVGVILAATLGSVVGTLPLYFLGKFAGEDRVARWADRHGKWFTLKGEDIRQADDWFDRYGTKVILFGRMVPGIRSLLSLPAGISEMPLPKFLLYSAIGSGLWATALTGAGYALGENFEQVEHLISPIGKVVVGVFVAWAAWVFIRRKKAQAQESTEIAR